MCGRAACHVLTCYVRTRNRVNRCSRDSKLRNTVSRHKCHELVVREHVAHPHVELFRLHLQELLGAVEDA